mmetsp:Transcript_25454/g.71617  ORF Transcript_25454/g.71617 Transcript_25454/m.71617 type:complete len:211 (-) Transcript_25454:570-1202(-)
MPAITERLIIGGPAPCIIATISKTRSCTPQMSRKKTQATRALKAGPTTWRKSSTIGYATNGSGASGSGASAIPGVAKSLPAGIECASSCADSPTTSESASGSVPLAFEVPPPAADGGQAHTVRTSSMAWSKRAPSAKRMSGTVQRPAYSTATMTGVKRLAVSPHFGPGAMALRTMSHVRPTTVARRQALTGELRALARHSAKDSAPDKMG